MQPILRGRLLRNACVKLLSLSAGWYETKQSLGFQLECSTWGLVAWIVPKTINHLSVCKGSTVDTVQRDGTATHTLKVSELHNSTVVRLGNAALYRNRTLVGSLF